MPYGRWSGAGAVGTLEVNVQNGNYILQPADRGKLVLFEGVDDADWTIPDGGFLQGDVITVESDWAALGVLSIIPEGGVELTLAEAGSPGPVLRIEQTDWPARLVLVHDGNNVWSAAGANWRSVV